MKLRIRLSYGASAVLTTCLTLLGPGANDAFAYGAIRDIDNPPVDLAICLDTSGSMNGLIESAKQKLWAIVNELAMAQPTPDLRVALITFGNDGHTPENGWVQIDTDFTSDLDMVSQKLFSLRTNGGTEFVGRALQTAGQLQWHPSTGGLKLVVIAGNESADQDQESPFRDVCKTLIARDIMVNSIYCGPPEDSLAPAWREVAMLSDGKFACIDQNQGTIVIETPFDVQLGVLSTQLNTTYLPFGVQGQEAWGNQRAQDSNAVELNTAAVAARCSTKGSALYNNRSWDLVDACDTDSFEIGEVADEDLPEVMRPMTMEERIVYVAGNRDQRNAIKTEIKDISAQRTGFIEAEMKKRALDDSGSFDNAIRSAIREQAKSRGFTFVDETAAAKPAKTTEKAASAEAVAKTH